MFRAVLNRLSAWFEARRRVSLEQELEEIKDHIACIEREGRDYQRIAWHPRTNAEWFEHNKRKFGRIWKLAELELVQESLERVLGISRPAPDGFGHSF